MTRTTDLSRRPTISQMNDDKVPVELHCPVCGRWCLNYKGILGYLEVRCKNKHWFRVRNGVIETLLASEVIR